MIFKPELAQKVLKGEKTQTRRLVRPGEVLVYFDDKKIVLSGEPTRTKWVVGQTYAIQPGRTKAAIGRFKLLDIRRERVQDISEGDAIAEGVELNHYYCDEGTDLDPTPTHRCDPIGKFLELFESINGKAALDKEVWVLVFEVEGKGD